MGKKQDDRAALITFRTYLQEREKEIDLKLAALEKERELILSHKDRVRIMLDKTIVMILS
jgi:hypothetical protein